MLHAVVLGQQSLGEAAGDHLAPFPAGDVVAVGRQRAAALLGEFLDSGGDFVLCLAPGSTQVLEGRVRFAGPFRHRPLPLFPLVAAERACSCLAKA